MRTSGFRLVRKLIGYVLLIVNLILSTVSALAVYSVVEFAGNKDNYHFESGTSASVDLFATVPYIYIGNVTIRNTGLFDFNDFEIEFKLINTTLNGTDQLLLYNGRFGDIKAGEQRTLYLNLTTIPGVSTLQVNTTYPTPWVGTTSYGGYLDLRGKYVLSLFAFSFNITNLETWASLP